MEAVGNELPMLLVQFIENVVAQETAEKFQV
jgi:hypothetical protein